ncbi:hypothetical protein MMC28_007452 [Mycoblastus sanguinarius]|nr:hypothetical protein [Mycoblastus sanguinarius]
MNHTTPAPTASATSAAKGVSAYTYGLTGVNLPVDDQLTYILWCSIGALCLVILVVRFGQMANAHLRHLLNLKTSPLQQSYWSEDRTQIWPTLKKQLLYAPLWKKRHNKEFQLSRAISVGTLPSRLHTLVLLFYLVSNVFYCMYLDYSHPKAELLAELRGRTGHLAIVNMVPLIILAGRNNPLISLLRVSFDTYNLFHRWIGRVVVLQAFAHTIAWAINEVAAKGFKGISSGFKHSPFLAYGLLGTVAMCCILVQSPSMIRHAFYETFLHIHQVLAIAAITGVKVHCNLGKLPGESYIDWVIALWVLERCLRLVRIIYRNVSLRRFTKVTVEALEGPGVEACRVSIELVRPWRYKPGCHVYLYLPSVSFWMNHPFSIAWSEERPTPYLALEDEKLPDTKSDLDLPVPTRTSTTISLIMAKRTGMTAKLFDKARASPSGIITTYGLAEGPYGGLDSLHSYGTVILFAAGVGITHQIGHVRDLLEGHEAGTIATQKVVLVWSVKNTETLEWIRPWMDEILQMPNRKQVLKVYMFVTQPRSAREVVSRSETVQMFPGRCNPGVVLGKEVASRVGAISVTSCGPGAFQDEVRGAVRGICDQGATVDFVEESFTW